MPIALAAALATASLTTPACSWDRPGVNPFVGDVVAAVDAYQDIPTEVRARLKSRMLARQYDEIVVIGRDRIDGKATYAPQITGMHFGRGQVCGTVTRASWTDQHRERGLVYCEAGHCVMVPTVCRNVSRVTRESPAPAVLAARGFAPDGVLGAGGAGAPSDGLRAPAAATGDGSAASDGPSFAQSAAADPAATTPTVLASADTPAGVAASLTATPLAGQTAPTVATALTSPTAASPAAVGTGGGTDTSSGHVALPWAPVVNTGVSTPIIVVDGGSGSGGTGGTGGTGSGTGTGTGVTPVPEPSQWLQLAGGLALLGVLASRRGGRRATRPD